MLDRPRLNSIIHDARRAKIPAAPVGLFPNCSACDRPFWTITCSAMRSTRCEQGVASHSCRLRRGTHVASFVLPTAAPFNPEFSDTTYTGYVAFGTWKVLLDWQPWDIDWWVLGGCWFANPAVWLAIAFILVGWWRAGAIAAGCGLLLGLVVLPRYHPIIAGLPGYWAWVGSAVVLLTPSVYMVAREFRRTKRCTRVADRGGIKMDDHSAATA